jgi:hypothetical protein
MTSPNVFAYTDQLFSVPVSGLSSDGAVDSEAPTNWATSSTQIEFLANTSTGASTTIQVPAGATRYFEVRGTVSGSASGASISTQLEGDTGYPSLSTLMTPAQTVDNDGNDDFLWSPNSTTTAAYNDDDWTNGFGLIGLPSSNMTAEIVSQ